MKKLRAVLLILWLLSVFVVLDFGMNFAVTLIPSMNDGLRCYSILHGLFGVFGDQGRSQEGFFHAFEIAAWISFAALTANMILALLAHRNKD